MKFVSFWMGRRSVAASVSDHSIVWLIANESDLTSSSVDGYRVQFGDDTGGDNIFLQRITNGAVGIQITSSGTVPDDLTDIGFMVRITRTSASLWTIYTSTLPTANGEGAIATEVPSAENTTVLQGSGTEDTYTLFDTGYFGFVAVHGFGSNAREAAEFDQLYFDTDSESSLPVELTLWTARSQNGTVFLDWVTESEIENLGFILYKRLLGYPFDWLTDYRFDPTLHGQGSTTTRTEYHYIDSDVKIGTTYQYQLSDVSYAGVEEKHSIRVVTVRADGISWKQAYPNPFNSEMRIDLTVGEPGHVSIYIYNVAGKLVTTLMDMKLPAGEFTIKWNGKTDSGIPVASGIFFLKLNTEAMTRFQKIVIVR